MIAQQVSVAALSTPYNRFPDPRIAIWNSGDKWNFESENNTACSCDKGETVLRAGEQCLRREKEGVVCWCDVSLTRSESLLGEDQKNAIAGNRTSSARVSE